jgi:hypothetical protein
MSELHHSFDRGSLGVGVWKNNDWRLFSGSTSDRSITFVVARYPLAETFPWSVSFLG